MFCRLRNVLGAIAHTLLVLCASFFQSLGVLEKVLVAALAALHVRGAPEMYSSCLHSHIYGMDGLVVDRRWIEHWHEHYFIW